MHGRSLASTIETMEGLVLWRRSIKRIWNFKIDERNVILLKLEMLYIKQF